MFVCLLVYLYLILTESIQEVLPAVIVLDKGIIPVQKNSIGLQFYVDIENIDHRSSCSIRSWPKMCCLDDDLYKDCGTDTIYGDNIDTIIPERRETLIYLYTTLYQHDLVGYCDFVIDFKCGNRKRSVQIDVNIPFNTNLKDKTTPAYLDAYTSETKSKCESMDEDTLRECLPVNCDLKYSGRRPFFDRTKRKCLNVPDCNTNIYEELPDVVYVPISNTCRDLDKIVSVNDVYAISSGMGVTNHTLNKKNSMTVLANSNCTTISQNVLLLKDLLTGKLCNLFKGDNAAYNACCSNAVLSICACVIATTALLISIICCINSSIWLFRKIPKCKIEKMCKSYRCFEAIPKERTPSRVNLRDTLLKEVIVRDIPVELRDSVVEICDRIGREVGQRRRYRMVDLGSQVDLNVANESASSSGRSYHDED